MGDVFKVLFRSDIFGHITGLSIFSLSQLHADISPWNQLGPWGGDMFRIYQVPEDSQKLYVVGHTIHTSEDGGENWRSLVNPSDLSPGLLAYSLAIDPTDTEKLYIGTLYGVWKTTNGGDSWDPIKNGFTEADQVIRSVLLNAVNPDVIYASTSMYSVFSDSRDGDPDYEVQGAIYRSLDRGMNWEPFDTGIPGPPHVTALYQDPVTMDIYAATFGYGVFKLDSESDFWVEKNNGISPTEGLFITHLAFDPNAGGVIFAGTHKDWVYKSEDGGETWEHLTFHKTIPDDYPPMAYHIAVDPNNSDVVWVSAFPGRYRPHESPFYSAQPDQGLGGLFLSINGGASWSMQSSWIDSLPDAGPFGITLDPSEIIIKDEVTFSKNFYAASGGLLGIMKSIDAGKHFEVKTKGLGAFSIDAFSQHPLDGSMLFATSEGALHFSFDKGQNWSCLLPVVNDGIMYLWDVKADPINPNMLYYAAGNPAWAWPQAKGLYKLNISHLDPEKKVNVGPGEQIASTAGIGIWEIYPNPDGTIYLATQDRGILKSINSGESWQEVNEGLGDDEYISVSCIAFDDEFKPLYVGLRKNNGMAYPPWFIDYEPGSLFKWDAQLSTWIRIGESIIEKAVISVKTSQENPDKIYVATLDGIYVSNDGGATWDKKNKGLPNFSFFTASDLDIDPDDANRIFMSSYKNGVYASNDGGEIWFMLRNLKHSMIESLLFDQEDASTLYLASMGASILKLDLSSPGKSPIVVSVIANGKVLSEPHSTNILERNKLVIEINAQDPEGQPVFYGATLDGQSVLKPGQVVNPDNVPTFDPDTGTFEWTPFYKSVREEPFNLLLTASDGVFATVIQVDIFVESQHKPVLEWVKVNGGKLPGEMPYEVTVKAEELVEIQVQARDEDGDILTYNAFVDTMPARPCDEVGADSFCFDNETHTLTWTPPNWSARSEPYEISLIVGDCFFFPKFSVVNLTVIPLNAPEVDWVRANGIELTQPYEVSVTALEQFNLQLEATDPDGDSLTYIAFLANVPVPTALEVEDLEKTFTFDPETHIFSWKPPLWSARLEPWTLTFVITDGNFYTRTTVNFTVMPLNAPVVDWVAANGVELIEPYEISVYAGEAIEVQVEASDPDGDLLTYIAYLGLNPVLAPTEVEDPENTFTFNPESHIFRWVPPKGNIWPQTFRLTVLIRDSLFYTKVAVNITVLRN